jgi:hypothetical protein
MQTITTQKVGNGELLTYGPTSARKVRYAG